MEKTATISGLPINFKNLSIGYNKKSVFKNMNLSLQAGEGIIIQGENGIGKTTIIRTLLGEIPPVNGSITIDGTSINKMPKGVIGYIKQEKEKQNFPTNVREVVNMGIRGKLSKHDRNKIIEESLKKTKSETLINRNYYTLSGGEKQRVSIARTIAQNAKILILDEPTSFLDSKSEKELVTLLQNLSQTQRPTIICVTHDVIFTKNLQWRVYIMEKPSETNKRPE